MRAARRPYVHAGPYVRVGPTFGWGLPGITDIDDSSTPDFEDGACTRLSRTLLRDADREHADRDTRDGAHRRVAEHDLPRGARHRERGVREQVAGATREERFEP